MENELNNYVIVPRKVASDYHNGIITRPELFLYLWLRLKGNPYGITHVGLKTLADDVFDRVTDNYVNQLLLSLKRKRFIFYEQRSGRRGTFEVHLGEWFCPSKDKSQLGPIKRLDKYFESAPTLRSKIAAESPSKSEDTAELSSQGQRSEKQDFDFKPIHSMLSGKSRVRGADNDTDTDKESDINRTNRTFKNKMPLDDFKPTSHPEEQCLVIAKALGEKDMAFILGSMKKYGFSLVEQAWRHCREAKQFPTARNKGAFFNKILQQFASGYQGESQTI